MWPVKIVQVVPETLRAESSEQPIDSHESSCALTLYGVSGYYANGFELTDVGIELWNRLKSVVFPNHCCVCGAAAEIVLSVYEAGIMPRTTGCESQLNGVPHCAKHGRSGFARLVVSLDSEGEQTFGIGFVGVNLSFLRAVKELNSRGDKLPPWVRFPGFPSYSGFWRQGSGEGWLWYSWRPYWEKLDRPTQQSYLHKWKPPEDWQYLLDRWQEERAHSAP